VLVPLTPEQACHVQFLSRIYQIWIIWLATAYQQIGQSFAEVSVQADLAKWSAVFINDGAGMPLK
jgi:hypothetical protein